MHALETGSSTSAVWCPEAAGPVFEPAHTYEWSINIMMGCRIHTPSSSHGIGGLPSRLSQKASTRSDSRIPCEGNFAAKLFGVPACKAHAFVSSFHVSAVQFGSL
jgi:hypothetical protein